MIDFILLSVISTKQKKTNLLRNVLNLSLDWVSPLTCSGVVSDGVVLREMDVLAPNFFIDYTTKNGILLTKAKIRIQSQT